jgi:hypothetical protein
MEVSHVGRLPFFCAQLQFKLILVGRVPHDNERF